LAIDPELKNFIYWRGEVVNAKTLLVLKSVGEDLARFQNQSDLLSDVPKLKEAQLGALRAMYSDRLKKLESEKLDVAKHERPEFNK
jgi:hypothetical protein